ncbi:MAG TPA: hypothetical protein VJA17_04620 [Candidatus Omnitrophota bacterium]|nr:hypothetical protein [Candidatus Omnitrophota bacterium]
MGRWSYSSRWTVEECKSITIKFLNKHHYFNGSVRWGGMNWSRNGEQTGSIGFVVSTVEGDEYIRFQYTQTDRHTQEKTELDYNVRLVWTPCHFGGRRWWFICPLVVNGYACNRRVGVLYLASGKYFGCRHCHNLTYQSSKEHDKRLDAFKKNPELLMAFLDSKDSTKRLLAMKAGVKYIKEGLL